MSLNLKAKVPQGHFCERYKHCFFSVVEQASLFSKNFAIAYISVNTDDKFKAILITLLYVKQDERMNEIFYNKVR
jgi:hypothetical protein